MNRIATVTCTACGWSWNAGDHAACPNCAAPAPHVEGESDCVTPPGGAPRAAPAGAATPRAPRAHRRVVGCPNCGEHFTPAAAPRKRPTRYLPPDARFVSFINARGGSASLSAIGRRFHVTAAERDVLLSRLTAAGAGLILHNFGRGGGLFRCHN